MKYTKQELIKAVQNSKSISGTLKKLGVAPYGGNYEVFKRYIKNHNIDISHFLGQGWNKGNSPAEIKPIEAYLSNNIPITSYKLKNKLLKLKIKSHGCEMCKKTTWLNKPIPLELHHINGNNKDNLLENLLLLCPNCHALTNNYRNRNAKEKKKNCISN